MGFITLAGWRVLVSFIVSFSYVRRHPAHTTRDRQPRSRTLLNYGEPKPTDLESVLGASPRGFESRILRHADQVQRALCGVLQRPAWVASLFPSLIRA